MQETHQKSRMTNAHLCLTPYKQRHTKLQTALIDFFSNILNFCYITIVFWNEIYCQSQMRNTYQTIVQSKPTDNSTNGKIQLSVTQIFTSGKDLLICNSHFYFLFLGSLLASKLILVICYITEAAILQPFQFSKCQFLTKPSPSQLATMSIELSTGCPTWSPNNLNSVRGSRGGFLKGRSKLCFCCLQL